jgi:(p)ppGpp synthase/HD superfamily hydrolase
VDEEGAAPAGGAAAASPYPVVPGRHPGFVLLGARFEDALAYVAWAHREQSRKETAIPYLGHLLGVTSIVLEAGGDEDQAIGALLHDTVEDCGAEHVPVIEERFGPAVLDIVLACSDSVVARGEEKPPWRQRKEAYLAHLDELGPDHPALLVSVADKLHNARSIRADLRLLGPALWKRFNRPATDELWYYRSLVEAFQRLAPAPLTDELARTVSDIRRIHRALGR